MTVSIYYACSEQVDKKTNAANLTLPRAESCQAELE